MTTTLRDSGRRHPLTPVAPPRVVDDLYGQDEVATLFGVIAERGPWPLIVAHHFRSTEEYLAVSGGREAKPDATLSDFAAPVFRGYFAKEGVAFYEELRDIYQGRRLLEHAKSVHGAAYGMPHHMLFNLAMPSHSFDAGHFDSGNWRGMSSVDTPIWLLSVMAKSGLFDHWEVKTAQVIAYFYDSDLDGGFTYWPDGPDRAPRRLPSPFWNTGVLADNSRMYHRREASGPRDLRDMPDLEMDSRLHAEGGEWVVRNGDREIGRYTDGEVRTLFHYTALVFDDRADADRYLDHTDDLTPEKVFDVLGDDLSRRGIAFDFPADPMTNPEFIALLNNTYAVSPAEYPPEAPLDIR
ncbi:hypothetical protein [Saccharopolyspora flava]|uniref:Uncharacterized protein n=1 Tax=Saccharopolyspora flava TaxID=95161 RepID=A0A1I6UG61_9PSEU|nr:hypothetical protein [Saccharopolyspora flava]SFT00277.1 hypothetical protein SAMN05660874_04892 [Saccharopolyspora flava]